MNLKEFANHNMPQLLSDLKCSLMVEPWGKNNKILSTYINVNFEVAHLQNKVFADEANDIAFWKVGNLVSIAGDPLWFVYEKNRRQTQMWNFKETHYGNFPPLVNTGKNIDEYQVEHNCPTFRSSWQFIMEPSTVEHIMSENQERLIRVFGEELSKNQHMLFRTILGELELQKKRSDVMHQWFFGKYQFLMPLYLKNPDEVSLTATLEPLEENQLYRVRTLLYPEYAYPHIRAVIKNRSAITGWMNIFDDVLDDLDYNQGE